MSVKKISKKNHELYIIQANQSDLESFSAIADFFHEAYEIFDDCFYLGDFIKKLEWLKNKAENFYYWRNDLKDLGLWMTPHEDNDYEFYKKRDLIEGPWEREEK